jgi:hypothetical protein
LDPLGHFDASPGCWPSLAASPGRAMWGGGALCARACVYLCYVPHKDQEDGCWCWHTVWAPSSMGSVCALSWHSTLPYSGIVPYPILVLDTMRLSCANMYAWHVAP